MPSFYRRKKHKMSPFGADAIKKQEKRAKFRRGLMGFYTDEQGRVRPITSPSERLKAGDRVRIVEPISKPKPIRVKKIEPKPRIEKKPEEPKVTVEPKKPREPVALKPIAKKQPVVRKMSGIERRHLLAFCKQFELDPQEIDDSITYYENKDHLQELARERGVSEEEIVGAEQQIDLITAQYEQYLGHLRSELESAGYVISEPNMPSM